VCPSLPNGNPARSKLHGNGNGNFEKITGVREKIRKAKNP
jgi:hypothetical protein